MIIKNTKMLNCIAILLSLNLAFGAFPSCTPDNPVTDGTEQPSTPEEPGKDDKPDTPDPGDKPSEPGENPDPSEPSEPETPDDGILRILAIGNSFSQDAVEQYLYQLFDAAGQKVIIGNLYIGGCSLERHWGNTSNGKTDYYYRKVVDGVKNETKNVTLLHGLTDEKWDIISLQQSSGVSGQYASYNPYLPNLIAWLRENAPKKDFKLAWHQTWAYASSSTHSAFPNYGSDQMTMYNAIVDCTQKALNDNKFDLLIPSGTAIQDARTSMLGDSFNRDGYHLEVTYGRYTAACTWFEAISGQSVVGNSYAPETVGDFEKQIAQNAAHLAVQKPYEVTEMVDFQKPYTGTPEFSSPVQIDFGAGSAASPDGWNRVAVSTLSNSIYLKGRDGEWSPLVIEKLDGFTSTYNGVGGEPDKPVTIGGIEYPKSVWADGIMVSGTKGAGDTPAAGVTISGFNSAKSYLLRIVAVRFNGSDDARCSEYTVKGASESEKQSIWTGMKTYDESADFSKYMVEFAGVRPDGDGRIKVSVVGKDTEKAADGHINVLVISEE